MHAKFLFSINELAVGNQFFCVKGGRKKVIDYAHVICIISLINKIYWQNSVCIYIMLFKKKKKPATHLIELFDNTSTFSVKIMVFAYKTLIIDRRI